MRIPLSWLREIVDIAPEATPEQVHADLVRVGFEEESIRRFEVTGPVVVGQVLAREPEPQSNGKTINWCQVRVAPEGERAADGGEDVRGIVCGAHNFEVGDKVVVTLPGAVLPGDFRIAARTTYGHVSDGMIASQRELGLGDDHEGIIVLSRLGLDPEVGADAIALLGLDDTAVEINVTPDRGYAFSLRGVARELSHATGAAFHDPVLAVEPSPATGIDVTLADDAPIRGRVGATGFVTRLVRDVDPQAPTPAWMVARLQLAGIRSLGLAVDLSNYVMLEIGNPLHAYDFAKLSGDITVRRARAGERLTTLDGQERALHPEDLLIADESGPIGLAGVMGGESTKTDETTTDILIEAALFDPVSIARTARRHKLPSEASKRFERGVDPLVARAAADRMARLLVEFGGGTIDARGSDIVAEAPEIRIPFPIGAAEALVGVAYTPAEVRDALNTIGCSIDSDGTGDTPATLLTVTPPTWRTDLTRPADLVEEIARIVGYDRIPSVLPVAPPGRGRTREQQLRRRAADALTAAGFTEVQTYPFVSQRANDTFAPESLAPGEHAAAIRLANPLDGEAPFLRRSILPGLAQTAGRNLSRGTVDLALIEFGSVFEAAHGVDGTTAGATGQPIGTADVPPLGALPDADTLERLDASIPTQPLHVGVLLTGQAIPKQVGAAVRAYDWADALDAARLLAHALDIDLIVRQGSHPAYHPGRTAELLVRVDDSDGTERSVGFAGELLPELAADLHFLGRVAVCELDVDALIAHAPREARVHGLSTYPAATQDLTLVVPAETVAQDLLDAVTAGAGELLEAARLVDDYRGTGIEAGKKALTFALRFRAADRTLKAEEATEAKLAGVALAAERFEATIRD